MISYKGQLQLAHRWLSKTDFTVILFLILQAVLADPGLKDGFSLATKIILTFHLPTEDILCHMAKALVLAERYSDVKDLLVLVQSSEICPESSNDKIIISAVKVLSQQTKDVSHPASCHCDLA